MEQLGFEVEQKFRVTDFEPIEKALRALGAREGEVMRQVDVYFAHPARDFAQTDEAFRLRCVGEGNWLTYKGPKLDARTKTRREIELAIAPGQAAAEQFRDLCQALGFRPVTEVVKRRREWNLDWQGRKTIVALDHVDHAGHFVELEQQADADQLEPARQSLAALADHLRIDPSANERRSYLELVLATRHEASE